RPGRSQHQALDALSVGIRREKVRWVLDADIQGFFDTLDHGWLLKFVEHRVGDRRVVRLIQKWLKAGVLEDGKRVRSEVGTVQGGSISPLLANIYLHYVLDLWVQAWRKKRWRESTIIVRYADDFILGFAYREKAVQFLAELKERLEKFGLKLHPEKTRLIEFGLFARADCRRRGRRKPETFDFLGFTHICGRRRSGWFTVLRKTMRKRLVAKLHEVKEELRKRRHQSVAEQGQYVQAVLTGHYRYYGVPGNSGSLCGFRNQVGWLWVRSLRRRSQTHRLHGPRAWKLVSPWLVPAHICHPHPERRFAVTIRGKSRMR
ncbi:MAG TPA: reverse transcriptase domain-containing protein, partial [Myxococcales bacterium]|nr:reverse transcriptase domain-containing protein [Myxococcales bacterium]